VESGGIVVVDKPPGMTSHDVVARCRRIFGQRRVGHGGTLDPDATGVLVVGVGRATRVLRFATDLRKIYQAEIVLGSTTSTLDASGVVLDRFDMGHVTLRAAQEAAATLCGEIDQVPPMVSAVKVGGRRLHELARAGIEVERQARRVTVWRFDLEEGPTDGVLCAEVECSSGTFVRSLAADLGLRLGGGAHLGSLRRVRVGSFDLRDARPLDALGAGDLRDPSWAVAHLEQCRLDDAALQAVSHGRPLDPVVLEMTGPGPWALLDGHGGLAAVYQARENRAVPMVVLVGQ